MAGRLNVVLFEPEIPQNAGNIMRTCVAAGFELHLIKPLGFDIDNPKFRRSTTNHITWAEYTLYENYGDFAGRNPGEYFFMTRYGKVPPSDIDFRSIPEDKNIYLILGKESTGIPKDILKDNLTRCFRIPMTALRVVDGYQGVYIKNKVSIEFRRVSVIYEGDGYVICTGNPEDADPTASPVSPEGQEYQWIRQNDVIVVEGTGIYSGKVVD